MKTYNVMFKATVDCSMFVTLDEGEEPNVDNMLEYVRDDCHHNYKVDEWVEQDDFPVLEIIDWDEV